MDVLVLEDEAPLREFEVAYLRDAGYGTVEAADGQRRSNRVAATRATMLSNTTPSASLYGILRSTTSHPFGAYLSEGERINGEVTYSY
jgi:DNA-binding response OmpR family regulator